MRFPLSQRGARLSCLAVLALGVAACQAFPPSHSVQVHAGSVAGADARQARSMARALDELAPRVRAELPDAIERPLSVWLQEVPLLYVFPRTAMPEADGFYSPATHRIHLRAGAEDLERTLAHELVHASLGPSWEALPGTLEEGLCDVVAARVCPASAARLRAGRLSSACLALGGLSLELALSLPPQASPAGLGLSLSARLCLEGSREELDPLTVFRSSAGLSSTKLSPHVKKALYGLAGMVVQRLVDRHGVEGLHELCSEAQRRGLEVVPTEWVLECAGLDADPAAWRRALLEGLGQAELGELLRLHPELAADALLEFLGPQLALETLPAVLPWLSASASVPESGAVVDLLQQPAVLRLVLQAARDAGRLREFEPAGKSPAAPQSKRAP